MRRFLSLLLILALILALGAAAHAEAPADGIAIGALEEIDGLFLEETVPSDELPLAGDGEALLLSDSLAVDLSDLSEAPEANASVPSSLTLGVGESYALKVSGAKKYQSSNAKKATVSSKGVIKGKAVGTATITVTMKRGDPLKVRVTVRKAPGKVSLNKSKLTLQAGKTYQLKAKLPSKTASKLTWSSSKKSVAKVSADGLITAVKAGTAVITVKTFNERTATCTVTVKAPDKKVGVSLPTDEFQRWTHDGKTLKSLLKKAGYAVDLRYAGNDLVTQISQIEEMIDRGCNALIVAPIEGYSLGSVMQKAIENSIPVISYDRLIMDSDAVSFYVTFNNYQVGFLQGKYIKDALKLDSKRGPFNIEFTAGDPGDQNAKAFFQGAMDVLMPYIEHGKLVTPSDQTEFEQVATPTWKSDVAQARAEDILSSEYFDGTRLDAWLCSNDSTALGVIAALEAKYTGKWPVITGQDCDVDNVRHIIGGKQAMSVFKDTTVLAKQTVKMIGQLLKGKQVDVNDTETFDNGAKVVPAFLCTPLAVTKKNYKKLLIDGGFYSEDMFQ
ncbi:MAG: substrate-binding domain-containing protein [Clostridia bacterium]|nr:substrate-binding domain-containing protein [Clostridia bacterium]